MIIYALLQKMDILIYGIYIIKIYLKLLIQIIVIYIILFNGIKNIIVADFDNKCFKIINLENGIIKDIEKQHTNLVICIKKIYHPKYGESLLSGACGKTIKLWSIN